MEQIWRNICAHYDVPEDVTNTWYARIEQHLSEESPTRAYHNWHEMMQRKHEHLSECAPSIALAAFFQYYHFDGNRSCVQQNCEVFEEFCRDAMIEDLPFQASTKSSVPPHKSHFRKFRGVQNKLANTLKRRAMNIQLRNERILPKHKIELSRASQVQPKKLTINKCLRSQLPSHCIALKKCPAQDVMVVEEIVSSDDDDDDCIVLEPTVTKIDLADDTDEEATQEPTDSKPENDLATDGRFEVDKKRELKLWNNFSNNSGNIFINYDTNNVRLPNKSDACITIDDSFGGGNCDLNTTIKSPPLSNESKALDDSVIFVEENYIPLLNGALSPKRKRNPNFKDHETRIPKSQKKTTHRMSESLFTSTERKKLADYNINTYNPGVDTDEPVTHKRPIIIDGSNVAFGHGRSNMFSAEGIKYCVEYFQKMGHDVKAVIPLFRRNPNKSSNPALLDELYKEGKIVFTPCKNLPNQQSISYDDRFILQLAYERNAAVVSNDNYRDLINENAAFKKIIENRVIGYSWCDNILILPKDPYGRFGPPLSEILRC